MSLKRNGVRLLELNVTCFRVDSELNYVQIICTWIPGLGDQIMICEKGRKSMSVQWRTLNSVLQFLRIWKLIDSKSCKAVSIEISKTEIALGKVFKKCMHSISILTYQYAYMIICWTKVIHVYYMYNYKHLSLKKDIKDGLLLCHFAPN